MSQAPYWDLKARLTYAPANSKWQFAAFSDNLTNAVVASWMVTTPFINGAITQGGLFARPEHSESLVPIGFDEESDGAVEGRPDCKYHFRMDGDLMAHRALFFAAVSMCFLTLPAWAAPSMKLWRLDCGMFTTVANNMSDTFAFSASTRRAYVDSCYLIQHGDQLLLWDAGLPLALLGHSLDESQPVSMTLTKSIASQLAQIGYKPSDVSILGLSHSHDDHTGQAAVFPQARLLLGNEDLEGLRREPHPFFADPSALRWWLDGKGKVDPVSGDRDIFGDGSAVMIFLPGHTPGHHGLMLHMPKAGAILLSGDTVHSHPQINLRGVPPSNFSRADSLASIERMVAIAENLHALLVIQHDPEDVAKLPIFPAYAE